MEAPFHLVLHCHLHGGAISLCITFSFPWRYYFTWYCVAIPMEVPSHLVLLLYLHGGAISLLHWRFMKMSLQLVSCCHPHEGAIAVGVVLPSPWKYGCRSAITLEKSAVLSWQYHCSWCRSTITLETSTVVSWQCYCSWCHSALTLETSTVLSWQCYCSWCRAAILIKVPLQLVSFCHYSRNKYRVIMTVPLASNSGSYLELFYDPCHWDFTFLFLSSMLTLCKGLNFISYNLEFIIQFVCKLYIVHCIRGEKRRMWNLIHLRATSEFWRAGSAFQFAFTYMCTCV